MLVDGCMAFGNGLDGKSKAAGEVVGTDDGQELTESAGKQEKVG